jgi:hypothetical protein
MEIPKAVLKRVLVELEIVPPPPGHPVVAVATVGETLASLLGSGYGRSSCYRIPGDAGHLEEPGVVGGLSAWELGEEVLASPGGVGVSCGFLI